MQITLIIFLSFFKLIIMATYQPDIARHRVAGKRNEISILLLLNSKYNNLCE